ncbi:Homoserine/homoserine lactone efflux protein [Photobacterium malacitanum]|uniref:Homoserine/homoserine lactone efflux protein n=1 Tax=Photobacterium malacitanum TaxID=2204294 RepID=A0A1Y6MCU6_9GAMM|nr:LysE family translocator [Photobacterium malacitanum]SMY34403.1 Homoserine/homoserine lactone efflux protein [Photobacterium malacitanum]
MTLDIWFYYVLAVFVLTASPGPSSLLCMTKGVCSGFKAGIYTALGSLSAIFCILTLSFVGLGVVIASSEVAFNFIKWSGAAYLIYLGVKSIIARQQSYEISSDRSLSYQSFYKHYLSGFVVGASNPKAIVFFTALFPQFIDSSVSLMHQYIVFSVTFLVFELSWLCLYAYLGSKSSSWIYKNGRAKLFNRLTGGVFISAGALLSTATQN